MQLATTQEDEDAVEFFVYNSDAPPVKHSRQYQTKTPRRKFDMNSARSDVNFKTPRSDVNYMSDVKYKSPQPQIARPQSARHSRYSQNGYSRNVSNSGMVRPRCAANLRSAPHGPRAHRRYNVAASVHESRQARYMRPPITTEVAPSRQGQRSVVEADKQSQEHPNMSMFSLYSD